MPSSSVRTFTDPDEYGEAVRGSTYRFTVTQRGSYSAKLTRIDLHSLWMQRFSDVLPRVAHLDISSDRAVVSFLTQPGSKIYNGVEYNETNIAFTRPYQSLYEKASGPVPFAAMSLPTEEMADVAITVAGRDLTPPNGQMNLTPSAGALVSLRRLHAAAGNLAEDAPAVLAHPAAARSLEHALIEAMIHCLGHGEVEGERAAQRHHAAIMRKFDRVIEEHLDEPLYIPELCREIGASLRTLNSCCQEHLGMGPKHYLLLRRMHMVRRALRQGTPADTTVTEVATRYGFWQFGRFAVEYKAIFAESPSATLARME